MNILEKIKINKEMYPERVAIKSLVGEISYQQLEDKSNKLAYFLQKKLGDNKKPIVVYGHKSPLMIVCFLACIKSGRAYCPVDVSVPLNRIMEIIKESGAGLVLTIDDLTIEDSDYIMEMSEIERAILDTTECIEKSHYVKESEVFYIIFTSGSTGTPKGVQITMECLDSFLRWAETLGDGKMSTIENLVFINQAPFSFDLSVMDLYLSLYLGGTLWCLDKCIQENMKELLESLRKSKATVWVSTPSFADMCLADKSFHEELMKHIRYFLFCGETLTNGTVAKLLNAFPKALVVNTYGPTESTVAITNVTISREVNAMYKPLPIGVPKPGTKVFIMDSKGNSLLDGRKGEIVIAGDSVSIGYLNQPELTKKAFGRMNVDGKEYRVYRTGDEGYLSDGMLFYSGRIDLQIKLHGYRIEIEDIENNLLNLKEIKRAIVIPVKSEENEVKYLVAFVISDKKYDSAFTASQEIRTKLKELLPHYMIPKKVLIIDEMPMTNNGKVDRKALGGKL